MNIRKTQPRTVYSALLVVLLAGLLSVPQPAQSSGLLRYWWTFGIFFDDGFNAVLTVDMGKDVNGSVPDPVVSEEFTVQCAEIGLVPIAGEVAEFNGGGHLECRVDIQSALEETYRKCREISKDCLAPPPGVDQYGRIVARASAALANAGLIEYPLIHAEDLNFGLQLVSPTAAANPISLGVTKTTGLFDVATAHFVNGASWGGPMAGYTGVYGCDDAMFCQTKFWAGADNSQTPLAPDNLIDFTLTPQTFYIGYNPDTGQRLHALVDGLFVDPGAVGSGGD